MPARKSTGKPRAGKTAAAPPLESPADRIVAATLSVAAENGWSSLTMMDVAARANVALNEMLKLAPRKRDLLALLFDRIDDRTFAGLAAPEMDTPVRDRLFDVLMRRFDALNAERDGIKAVLAGLRRDPPAALFGLCRLDRSMAAMIAAAGLRADGLCGVARIAAVKAVYLSALRAWAGDDTRDLAKTMAALDRALSLAEKVARAAPFGRRTGSEDAAGEAKT